MINKVKKTILGGSLIFAAGGLLYGFVLNNGEEKMSVQSPVAELKPIVFNNTIYTEYEELKNDVIIHYIENKDSKPVFESFQDLQLFVAILNGEMGKVILKDITNIDQIVERLVEETFKDISP